MSLSTAGPGQQPSRSSDDAPQQRRRLARIELSQERIVLLLALGLFALFSATLDGFADTSNVLSLVRSVSILGILSLGMAITVLSRGIDLSMVAVMAISVAWALALVNSGHATPLAFAAGFGFAVLIGVVNGVLIAYVQIPALFATLAMGVFIGGIGRLYLVDLDVVYVRSDIGLVLELGKGMVIGIPVPILVFAAFALIIHLLLTRTVFGRFVYMIGDNHAAAGITGVPVRPSLIAIYALASSTAFAAGVVTAMSSASMNTRLVSSTLVYDAILVVVLGGIGLSGGKGSVRSVIVGTILIGILLNGLTILDIQFATQNLIKSVVLLIAIVIDSVLNPRDEQTAQQGDI